MAPSRQSTSSSIVRFYDPDVQAKDALGRTQQQILAWNNSQLENSHNYIQMLFPLPEGSPYNWEAPIIDLDTMKAFRANSGLRQQLRRSFERMLTFYGFTTSSYPEVEEQKEDEITKTNEQEQVSTTHTPAVTTTTTTQPSGDRTQDVLSSSTAAGDVTTTVVAEGRTVVETPSAAAEASKPKSTLQTSPFDYHVVRGPNWREASRNWCVRFDHNHLRITRILRCLRVLGLKTECDAFFTALKRVYDDPVVKISDQTMMFWTRAVERPLYIAPDGDKCEWLKMWEAEQEKDD